MEDINALVNKLKGFRDKLPEVLPTLATTVSLTGKALAERVIKDQGFGKTYSENKLPINYFWGKFLNNRGLAYLQSNKVAQDGTTWGDFRKAQGLQDRYVDLTYSGKMWAGMFPQEVEINLFSYVAPLGNNTIEGQKKMNWNRERYGDFIGAVLVGDNLEIMKRTAYDELVRIMDRELGEFRV